MWHTHLKITKIGIFLVQLKRELNNLDRASGTFGYDKKVWLFLNIYDIVKHIQSDSTLVRVRCEGV